MTKTPKKDDYLKLLGQITVDFSSIEFWLKSHIWSLLGEDFGANLCVTAGASLMELSALFRALFLFCVQDDKLRRRCQNLFDKLKEINEDRNKYSHSEWFFAETPDWFLARRAKYSKRQKEGLVLSTDDNKIENLITFLENMNTEKRNLTVLMNDARKIIQEHLNRPNKNSVSFNEKTSSKPSKKK